MKFELLTSYQADSNDFVLYVPPWLLMYQQLHNNLMPMTGLDENQQRFKLTNIKIDFHEFFKFLLEGFVQLYSV